MAHGHIVKYGGSRDLNLFSVFLQCYYFILEFPLLNLCLLPSPPFLHPKSTHKPIMQLCSQACGGVEVDQQHSLQQVEGGSSCTYSVHSPRAAEHRAVRLAKQMRTQL